jgi:hypothetical protein
MGSNPTASATKLRISTIPGFSFLPRLWRDYNKFEVESLSEVIAAGVSYNKGDIPFVDVATTGGRAAVKGMIAYRGFADMILR